MLSLCFISRGRRTIHIVSNSLRSDEFSNRLRRLEIEITRCSRSSHGLATFTACVSVADIIILLLSILDPDGDAEFERVIRYEGLRSVIG
jgi:hypothetical protein